MEKNKGFARAARGICFLAVFVILFQTAQVLFHPKHHSQYTMDDFYRLPENSVDVLLCGSSHMVYGLDANLLTEKTGLNTYSVAINGQHLNYTYEYLKEALKTQSPKVVVIDSYHFIRDIQDMQIVDPHYSVDSLRWSMDKLSRIAENVPKEYWGELMVPLIRYHSRWRELTAGDIYYLKGPKGRGNRGFYGLEKVTPVSAGGWNTAKFEHLSENAMDLLNRFIELSETHGFEILFLNFPVTG